MFASRAAFAPLARKASLSKKEVFANQRSKLDSPAHSSGAAGIGGGEGGDGGDGAGAAASNVDVDGEEDSDGETLATDNGGAEETATTAGLGSVAGAGDVALVVGDGLGLVGVVAAVALGAGDTEEAGTANTAGSADLAGHGSGGLGQDPAGEAVAGAQAADVLEVADGGRAANASSAPGMLRRTPGRARKRNPDHAAASAQTANRPCNPAKRCIFVMSCQLAATQQTAALPSSKTPSHKVLRAKN